MLGINRKAQCHECKNDIRVQQKDGTEATEKWVCKAYKNGCPENVIVKAEKCPKFIQD
jgi:hypothetical protein